MSAAIQVSGLHKAFSSKEVLRGVDLEVAPGQVFALLGPNGAGKTTIVNILATLMRPDSGEVSVGGYDVVRDPAQVRAQIGVTGQVSAVDNILTARQNMRLMSDLLHLPKEEGRARAEELLERFGVADDADQAVSLWSGGMRRKLDLAMTLMGRPSIVYLDEPTTGLDPRSRHTLWDAVRELVAAGTTVLLTTQYLDEADQLADRVALLDDGRIVAEGSPAELKQQVPGKPNATLDDVFIALTGHSATATPTPSDGDLLAGQADPTQPAADPRNEQEHRA